MKNLLLQLTWCALLWKVGQSIILHDVSVPQMVVIDQETSSISISKSVSEEGSESEEYINVGDGNDTDVNVYHNYLTSSGGGGGGNNGAEDMDDEQHVEDDVVRLDCNYEVEKDSPPSYLVVKWFKDDKGIYQWIRGQQPSVFPYFRDHVGPIVATSSNPNHEFRGLTLINPSVELTGVYKCLVQTDQDSKFKEKLLQVIDISNYTLIFSHDPIDNGTQLNCSISNVYPEPTVHIESADEVLFYRTESHVFKLDNDYYEGSMSAVAGDVDDDADLFHCYVTFGDLPLNLTTQIMSSASKLAAWNSVLGLTWILLLAICARLETWL